MLPILSIVKVAKVNKLIIMLNNMNSLNSTLLQLFALMDLPGFTIFQKMEILRKFIYIFRQEVGVAIMTIKPRSKTVMGDQNHP